LDSYSALSMLKVTLKKCEEKLQVGKDIEQLFTFLYVKVNCKKEWCEIASQ
jgi:hypothetical protein